MNTHSGTPTVVSITGSMEDVCHDDFPLSRVQRGAVDKLGCRIVEVLWISPDYAIYRTPKGVFVHFSDCKSKAAEQRIAFTAICAELCELRYLTSEMEGTHMHPAGRFLRWVTGKSHTDQGYSLFDHNIAQSLMLLMEGKVKEAKAIASSALDMAVARSTNDNTIRYLRASIFWGLLICVSLGMCQTLIYAFQPELANELMLFFVAAHFGLAGATFSIITRVQSFEMKPCQQSNMNSWMALIRMAIGGIGGFAFYLFAKSHLGQQIVNPGLTGGWQGAALIGFLGGFAERMVSTIFQRTAAGLADRTGTPAQSARDTANGTAAAPIPVPQAPSPASPPSND